MEEKNNFQITIPIPFTNNAIERIAKLLRNNGLQLTERMVREAQEFCKTKDDFITNLEKQKQNGQTILIPENLKSTIRNLFTQIRNQENTNKAIYRLSIIWSFKV